MKCLDCENWAMGKKLRCWDCKRRMRGEARKTVSPKPPLIGKNYLDILTENMERQYPGQGRKKALEALRKSKITKSPNILLRRKQDN